MERHTRLSRAAVVLVAIALIASIAAAVWFASPDAPYVPSEDSGAALGTAAPAEDGTVAGGYQPSSTSTGISDNGTPNSAITTIRSSLASNKSYYLTDNITVTSFHTPTDWSEKDTFGSATLDGAGHTITIDAKSTGSYSDVGGLFVGLRDGAVIKNLTIKVTGFSFGVSGKALNAGIIAGYASGTNITIQNVKVILDYDTSNSSTSSQDNYAYNTNQADAITIRLGGLVGKVEKGTTTVKNVTVHNSAGGTYGFSAQSWTTNPNWPNNSTSQLSVGGFVGDVMDNGDLDAYQITYSTDGTGKISAVGESSSGRRNNQGLVGGVVGYLSNGSVDISGLVIDVPGAIGTLFTGHNMNTSYSGGFVVGHKNDAPTLSMSGIIVNDKSEIGNGAVDEDEYLVGNDGIWSGRVTYPSDVVEAVRFSSDGTPMFAIAKKAPTDATGIVAEIYQHQISIANPAQSVDEINWTESGLTSQFVAQDESEVGQLVWITLPKLTTTGSNDYELLVNYSTSSTYSVENYAAISSYDGSVYTGSKVYDEQILSTPYISVNNTTINAWTAPSGDLTNVGDGLAKVFTYDQSKLSGYTAVEYNGAVYLVNGTTVYSPSEIIVNGEAQTFVLGKNFSYTITPMPVTVTPNVPTTQLYEGGEMPELTVTSTVPADVEGTIAWDEGQTLSAEVTTYYWTWTPASSNYKTMKGSINLTVFEKEITAIEVTTQPDKLYYVAYEAFDPAGIVVTATYSDGSSAPLSNDEYEFTVMNGDINKLIVKNDTVTVSLKKGSGASTTIKITVSKLAVDVPTANQGLVYNGGEQRGVEASADGYYSLSGNTGTNAGDYVATARLTYTDNTRWNTADPDDTTPKEIGWSIAKKDVDIIERHTSKTYDGQEVVPTTLFTAQGVNDEELALTVTVDGGKTILNAGTYSVTASLAESETNYTADSVTITYTVNKKGIQKPIDSVPPYTYNGTEQVVTIAENADYTVNGTTKETDAGNYSCTIALTDKANTEWEDGTRDDITVAWSIIPMTIAGTVSAPTDLTYDGNAKEATFTVSSGELFNGDAVTIEYSGDNVNVSDGAITATAKLPVSGNYAWADDTAPSATFTISPKEITVTATSGSKEFAWIMASASELYELFELDGEKVNAEDKLIWKVNGEVADMSDGNVSEIFDAKEYRIEIASADANYTLVGTTSTTFTITPKKVEKPTVSDTREFTYNGGEQGFEIEENPEYEVKGDAKATDAGDYSFTIALKAPGNVVWSDGTTEAIAVDWKINNATFTSVTIEFAEGALDNLFTSSAMPTPTTITAEPTPLPGGVEGKFEWVESSLSEGTHTYNWTYTVPNYNVFEGTKELTAQAAVLESITLSGEYKTEYTAYDFFDIDNLVVTAHFSHGENQPGEDTTLALGEYTLTTASAQYDENGVPQLFVGDTYVTVTYQGKSVQIDIKVAPKQIVAPTGATGLVYDGTEKVGVTGGDGYTLSGNTTATDAGDYVATATLTDKANTVWEDDTTDDKTIEWSIAKMVVSGEIVAPESLVYDGSQKAVSFDGQLAGNDEFGIAYDGNRQDVTADGFTVTVSLPNDNNYEWADGVVTTAAYKIEPKRVYLGHGDYTWGVSYNGKAILVAELGGNTGDGEADLVFAYEDETLETKLDIVFDYVAREANGLTSLVDAGEYTIEFNLADSVVNYVADPYTTTLEITPMRVEATLTAPNEVYTGNEKNAILTVNTQLVGEDKVTVEYNNVNRIDYTGEEIVATAQLPNDNYVWAEGTAPTASFTIQKATIESVTVTVSDAPDGGWTTAMMPEFTSVSVKPDVEGEVVWDNGSLIAGENAVQPWTFVPATNNYEPYHGSVTLTVSQATLTGVSVEVKPSAYVAFDAFDRSSIVVEALYGEDRKLVTGYTLTFSIGAEDRLFAGTGITVTVAYTDGEVTQSAEFTIDVAKRTVAKPVVDTTVFDATGETITLPIAESEYYKIYGNTAIEPGRYVATVELKDAVNTMWEDGSTDVVSIAWTISEPVTSDEVIASILAMEKVTWQNAEEFLDLEARYNVLDESEQTAEATAKLATLEAQYDALRASALDDIKAAHEVTAKSLGKALAAAAAGLSAAAIALAIAKRRSI